MRSNRPTRKCVKKSQPTTPWDETTDSDVSEGSPNSEKGRISNIKHRLRGRTVSHESCSQTDDVNRRVPKVNAPCNQVIVNAIAPSLKGTHTTDEISNAKSTSRKRPGVGLKRSQSSGNTVDEGREVAKKRKFVLSDILKTLPSYRKDSSSSGPTQSEISVKGKPPSLTVPEPTVEVVHGTSISRKRPRVGLKRCDSFANGVETESELYKNPTSLVPHIANNWPRKQSSSSSDSDCPVPFKKKRSTPSIMKAKVVSASLPNTVQSTCPSTSQTDINEKSVFKVGARKSPSTATAHVVKGRTRREARMLLRAEEQKVRSHVPIATANVIPMKPSTGADKSSSKNVVDGNIASSQSKSDNYKDVINLCISTDDENDIEILGSDNDDETWEPEDNHTARKKSARVTSTRNAAKEGIFVSSKPKAVINTMNGRTTSERQSDNTDASAHKKKSCEQVVVADVHAGSKQYVRHNAEDNANRDNGSSIVNETSMLSSGSKAASDVIIYRNGKPVGVNPHADVQSLDGRFKRLLDQKRPMMKTLKGLTDITQFYYVMKDSDGKINKENDSVAQFIIDIGIIVKDAGKELIYRGRSMQHDISSMRADQQAQIKQELSDDNISKTTRKPVSTSKGKAPRTAEETLSRMHVCQICGHSYVKKENLETHLNRHADCQIVCTDCGKGFYSRANHRQHKESHVNGFLACSFCKKEFQTLKGLRAHVKRHDSQQYVCTIANCGKTYKDKGNFVSHVEKGHSTERTVPCVVCEKFFKSASVMRSHKSRDHKK